MLPLGVELKNSGQISLSSLYIASVMYVAAISLAYESILVFYAGIVSALWLAIDYGALLSNGNAMRDASMGLPVWLIIAFGLVQIFKCFDLHVTQRENFIYFPRISK